MKIYITGGGVNNKGAEAMLLIAIKQLRKIYGAETCFFIEILETNPVQLKLEHCTFVRCSHQSYKYALAPNLKYILPEMKKSIKLSLKRILRKGKNVYSVSNLFAVRNIIPSVDLAFDINGYALSSEWDDAINLLFLDRIKVMKKYGVPYILLPQSFGPFDYAKNRAVSKEMIKDTLANVSLIFAREDSGYLLLTEQCLLKNVYLADDIVLDYVDNRVTKDMSAVKKDHVAVIPNCKVSDDINECIEIYTDVIQDLLSKRKHVTLILHTLFDKKLCDILAKQFSGQPLFEYFKEEISPDDFISKMMEFEFAVASRYHSVIHSYKADTPCVIIAWAEKYNSLASKFLQSQYVTDAKRENIHVILDSVKTMIERYELETKTIDQKYQELLSSGTDAFTMVKQNINKGAYIHGRS